MPLRLRQVQPLEPVDVLAEIYRMAELDFLSRQKPLVNCEPLLECDQTRSPINQHMVDRPDERERGLRRFHHRETRRNTIVEAEWPFPVLAQERLQFLAPFVWRQTGPIQDLPGN